MTHFPFTLRLLLLGAGCLPSWLCSREVSFDAPASHFTESVPLGNGRLGAMVFGNPLAERIVLNESGMWSGSPQEADRPDGAKSLPEIRRLLLEGKNVEAEALADQSFTCVGSGSGLGVGSKVPFGCYQTLGNLRLQDLAPDAGQTTVGYSRTLDLETAVCTTRFQRAGAFHLRESFVSAPDEALVYRLTCSRPGSIAFALALGRSERAIVAPLPGARLLMSGHLNDGRGGDGVAYACIVEVRHKGGTLSVSNNGIRLQSADEAEILVTSATRIHTFAGRPVTDPRAVAMSDLSRLDGRSFEILRDRHVKAYQARFQRCRLSLAGSSANSLQAASTMQRLRDFAAGGKDPDLAALYFDYGRYLLISGSRPDGLPMNLQGIWAQEIQTPWNGDWHLNVNVQMNYWPAEVCGLGDLHTPLFKLTQSLVTPGEKTARAYYNARGWVAHVITNPWGFTSPAEAASWGSTTTGSAWLCQHIWDHYLFNRDKAFLQEYYPVLRGSALFYLDMLIEDPATGLLVTAPSNSPENSFLMPDGRKAHLCLGSTADMQILRYLFKACVEAAGVLDMDTELRARLAQVLPRLAPTRIGTDGRVMEWPLEYKEFDPTHRHAAHLWGLYPGFEISPVATPQLCLAAAKSLDVRGDKGTGWGLAFKMALRARLHDGDRAHVLLREHLRPADLKSLDKQWSGGTYANLFDAHPPFQIDGNLGGAAAIAEMLLQSEPDEITILPALPTEWQTGNFEGLRARGGHQVSARWQDGLLVEASVLPGHDGFLILRHGKLRTRLQMKAGQVLRLDSQLHPLSAK